MQRFPDHSAQPSEELVTCGNYRRTGASLRLPISASGQLRPRGVRFGIPESRRSQCVESCAAAGPTVDRRQGTATSYGPWHEMSHGLSNAATFPPKRQMAEGKIIMKAIVVTDQAAGTAGMKLVERPEPQAAINDVVVQIHASGFVGTELVWPSTWTDRRNRDRTPSIPGHELAGVVTAVGYGTRGVSIGQRVFGLTDWYRDGTLAEYMAVEARNLAPLPGDVDFTVGAALVMPGLTAWQGLFEHGRLQAGR